MKESGQTDFAPLPYNVECFALQIVRYCGTSSLGSSIFPHSHGAKTNSWHAKASRDAVQQKSQQEMKEKSQKESPLCVTVDSPQGISTFSRPRIPLGIFATPPRGTRTGALGPTAKVESDKWVTAEHSVKVLTTYETHGLEYRYGTCQTILL